MSKQKSLRLDSEIEKCRAESNFRRLNELLPQIAGKSSGLENLTNFFTGEALLETYLDSFESMPTPDPAYREHLRKAKKHLLAVCDGLNSLAGAAQRFNHIITDAHLLLAKLYYVCAHYDDCISSINKAKIEQDTVDLSSLRTLRLVAEAFALKALCLEAHKSTSRFQKSNRSDQILICFEKSVQLSIQYLSEYERYVGGSASLQYAATNTNLPTMTTVLPATSSNVASSAPASTVGSSGGQQHATPTLVSSAQAEHVGHFILTAMTSLPAMYAKRQEMIKCMDCYRNLLLNVDRPNTQHLQQVLCQNFAQLLLRNVRDKLYKPPMLAGQWQTTPIIRKADSLIGAITAPVDLAPLGAFPAILTDAFGNNCNRKTFCPDNRIEEVYLLLSISDTIGCKDAVLSRADDHMEAREKSLSSVKAVQDLLTQSLCSVRQYGLLSEMFERAMKFAYDDHFIWFQFALSLICLGRYGRAHVILKQCLSPDCDANMAKGGADDQISVQNQVAKYLMGSKLCFEQLGLYDEGLDYAKIALKLAQMHECTGLISRAHLLAGMCYSLKGQSSTVYVDKQSLMESALSSYHMAQRSDPHDPIAEFFLALQMALSWRLGEAAQLCRDSLTKNPEQPVALMLLALLLTADNQYVEALHLVEQALDDFPSHYGMLVLRLKLEMKLQRAGGALLTAKDLLLFWRLPVSSSSPDRYSTDNSATGDRPDTVASQVGASELTTTTVQGIVFNGASSAGIDLTDKESVFSSSVRPLTEYGGAVSTVSDSLGLAASNASRDAMTQYRMQSNIWLELAELFLNTDDYVEEVQECCDEACSTFPNSHQVLYLKGRLHQRAGRFNQAKSCFVASLGLFPGHLASARYLAETYEKLGNLRMAERVLRKVVSTEPYDHETWKSLSGLMAKCQKFKEASQCASTAASLEDSAPIMPFNVIPRILHVQ